MKQRLTYETAYRHLLPFLANLPKRFDVEGEVIYEGRNILKRFVVSGTTLIVKRYKVPHWVNRFAYTFIRPGKANRAYHYAQCLLKMGFRTPAPVAYIELKQHGLFKRGYFVSTEESYKRLFREFDTGAVAGRERILDDFATYTMRLHEMGVHHFDYSPGNILFEVDSEGYTHFSLLDLNRMHFGKLTRQQCLGNFARLTHNREVFDYIVHRYIQLRGWDDAACYPVALQAYNQFWDSRVKRSRFKERLAGLKKSR